MKKAIWLLLSFQLLNSYSQPIAGGRAAGMAGAALNLDDVFASIHNQAALTGVNALSVAVFHSTPFLLQELSTRGLIMTTPVNNGVLAAHFRLYGYSSYNEKAGGLAFARSFGQHLSAGIQLDYIGVSIGEGYGSRNILTFEGGFRIRLLNSLFLATHLFNPLRVKMADYNDERLPAIFRLGLSYHPSAKLMLAIDAEKHIDYPNRIKTGAEYQLTDKFFLRTGITSNPFQSAFGFGWHFSHFYLDLAATYHRQLGYSPHVSLTWSKKQ